MLNLEILVVVLVGIIRSCRLHSRIHIVDVELYKMWSRVVSHTMGLFRIYSTVQYIGRSVNKTFAAKKLDTHDASSLVVKATKNQNNLIA